MKINGNKVYIILALNLIWALYGYFTGLLDTSAFIAIIDLLALGGAFRHAISKAEK